MTGMAQRLKAAWKMLWCKHEDTETEQVSHPYATAMAYCRTTCARCGHVICDHAYETRTYEKMKPVKDMPGLFALGDLACKKCGIRTKGK